MVLKELLVDPVLSHREITYFSVKLHFGLATLLYRAPGFSMCLFNNHLLKPESLGSTTKQEQQNNETGPRHIPLSEQILEFPLRCESSLLCSCFELGSISYLALATLDLLLCVDWRAIQLSVKLNSSHAFYLE